MKRNMAVKWGYQGDRGPENWEHLCEWYRKGAAFPLQSPISLKKEYATENSEYQPLDFHYQKQLFTDKEFKNTIHFVPFDKKSYVMFENERYDLVDIHFHRPSEHFIEGRQFALECHLVHLNAKQENLVCGVMLDVQEDFSDEKNSWSFKGHQQTFNPVQFMPQEKAHFHYIGSLTTPPTSGPVHWFVFTQTIVIAMSFIQQFDEIIAKDNFRPLQDRKNRSIDYYA